MGVFLGALGGYEGRAGQLGYSFVFMGGKLALWSRNFDLYLLFDLLLFFLLRIIGYIYMYYMYIYRIFFINNNNNSNNKVIWMVADFFCLDNEVRQNECGY